MITVTTSMLADEKTWQSNFYDALFGTSKDSFLHLDRSTDGYTDGVLFEHKQNVSSYGHSKALSQALIYLCRFNRDGLPVPAKICLVSQEEGKCYVYDTKDYMEQVEGIETYANLKASDGIFGFRAGTVSETIEFDPNLSAAGLADMLSFLKRAPCSVKVHITKHNVYGWSGYYYDHAKDFKQKPEKKAFFQELRNPVGTLQEFIEPWTGDESDFKYIMDMLNDPMTQKKLGAFYTPPQYAELAEELVKQAIQRALNAGKKDYIILDRCAGTGNLEMYFDDEILSHVIVSTYELKEWMVLRDRFGGRVRHIIPPTSQNGDECPELNEDGFLSGANALTRDIIDNPEIRKYLDDSNCAVILFENPPYVETTGIEFQKRGEGKEASSWKNNFVCSEMKKQIKGKASNDMANVFIWSAFKYFLRQDTDSYIVFSPIKYWKAQHIIQKKFVDGYAFNRKHFHAPTDACISCIYWSNEDNNSSDELALNAVNLSPNMNLIHEGTISVKQIHSRFSEKYYDKRNFPNDIYDGIACELDGTESKKSKKQISVTKNWNSNIIGYLRTEKSGFDNPRLSSSLLVAGKYNAGGFYLRSDNFMEKLPIFAASRYTDYCNDWKVMSMVMKSADGADRYYADIANGALNDFLFKTMFWTCLSHYPHMRSLHGSDNRLYLNQLCFDGDTLANQKMAEYIASGYTLTEQEQILLDKMNVILDYVKTNCKDEYRSEFHYGLYQIDEEINVKINIGKNADGSDKKGFKYGELNNMIKEFKVLLKQYYLDNLVDVLFEYEFLK